MRTELRKRVVEKTDLIFIADDGMEFYNEHSCVEYEKDMKRRVLEEELEKFEIKEARDYIPPSVDASDCSDYYWYRVQNNQQRELLNERYNVDLYPIYPDVICIEEYARGEGYYYRAESLMLEIKELWSKLGYDVVVTEKKTESNL